MSEYNYEYGDLTLKMLEDTIANYYYGKNETMKKEEKVNNEKDEKWKWSSSSIEKLTNSLKDLKDPKEQVSARNLAKEWADFQTEQLQAKSISEQWAKINLEVESKLMWGSDTPQEDTLPIEHSDYEYENY